MCDTCPFFLASSPPFACRRGCQTNSTPHWETVRAMRNILVAPGENVVLCRPQRKPVHPNLQRKTEKNRR